MLVATLVVALLGAGTVTARGDDITLGVSGTLNAFALATCSPSPCILGGELVINNTTDAIMSESVTFARESPVVGPFTKNNGLIEYGGLADISITDSAGDILNLFFASSSATPLVGYHGGPLASNTNIDGVANPPPLWRQGQGSLTDQTPEPPSVLLLASGLAALVRKRLLRD